MLTARFLLTYIFLFTTIHVEAFNPPQKESESEPQSIFLEDGVQLLSDYLKFPSITGNEIEAGQFFEAYCKEKGLHITRFQEDTNSYNFAASIHPLKEGRPNIILMHHIDVVPAGNWDKWTHAPYGGVVADDGYIYGRGTIDAKGLGVMQLMATLELIEHHGKDFDYNITLLVVSNEEAGGRLGAKLVVDEYFDLLNPAVVFGEGGSGLNEVLPSNPDRFVYGVSIAEKKSLWLRLELDLKSYGHGAAPSRRYANKNMIEALSRLNNRSTKIQFETSNRLMFKELGRAEGGARGFFIRNANWRVFNPFVKRYIRDNPLFTSLLTNTITITNIYNPPGAPNQNSELSTAYLDCRLLPETNKEDFVKQIKRKLREPKIEISVLNQSPSALSSPVDGYYDLFEEAILKFDPDVDIIPILFPATTDNSYFRERGVPVYGIFPAKISQQDIQNVHNIDERLSVRALNNGIMVYYFFFKKLLVDQNYPKEGIVFNPNR
ncbi:MAG: M20/M25/M40 family metallo-hydrolase [Cyclobacteriaceae bacterium]|nr:M20/M25/M40 family metallo-hydrolase [Cyclobacteriaceae bacterium]MCH8515376.1 M20/M25/M40 family metallo-hydrolase [Cyclobacteriaceae bacterium]